MRKNNVSKKSLSKKKKIIRRAKPRPAAAPAPQLPVKAPVSTVVKAGPGERTAKENRRIVGVYLQDDKETFDRAIARELTKPSVTAASTIQVWDRSHEVNALSAELTEQIKLVHNGDLKRAEGLLIAQAQTLDLIFNRLAVRSVENIYGGFMEAGETYLRLAMRAQGQCRATLETLAEIKNPLMGAYVRQANIAKGHQQVNNGDNGNASHAPAKTEDTPNKLLEVTNAERLDTGAASATIETHTELATVGAIHGAANSPRESPSSEEPGQGGHPASDAEARAIAA